MKVLKLYMMMLIVGMCCSCDEYLEVKNYGQVLPETDEDYATLINNQLSAIDKGTAGAANMLGSFAWKTTPDPLTAGPLENSYTNCFYISPFFIDPQGLSS